MFDAVWSRVVEGNYRSGNGIISGFVRKAVNQETYPAVYPAEGHHVVEGKVYYDVSDSDIARLDAFEGDYYRREKTFCDLGDGTGLEAWVYVFKNRYLHLVATEDWDPTRFANQGLQTFISGYSGFGEVNPRHA
jgi:gamma-glutamylcyclotransferase (GGCT)/AIG2-like uncharacterized protein YtfP